MIQQPLQRANEMITLQARRHPQQHRLMEALDRPATLQQPAHDRRRRQSSHRNVGRGLAALRNNTGNLDLVAKWLADGTVDAYGTNRQRQTEIAARNPGYRLLPDNFYGVEQSVIVPKGHKALLEEINAALDEARRSGLVAEAISRSGLIGLDVAPARP